MTLREYILTRKRNYWTGRVLFGQLLEAIVFLFDNQISHRDMKSDNILLDFDCDSQISFFFIYSLILLNTRQIFDGTCFMILFL